MAPKSNQANVHKVQIGFSPSTKRPPKAFGLWHTWTGSPTALRRQAGGDIVIV
jgi:hypothetical protein